MRMNKQQQHRASSSGGEGKALDSGSTSTERSRLLYIHAGAANTESPMTLSAPLFPKPEWIFYLNKTNPAVRTSWQPAELKTQCSTDAFFNNSTECTQSQIQNDQKGLGSLNTKQGSRRLTALHLERLAAIGFEEPKHVISCGSRKINKESDSGQLVTYIIYCFYKVPSL